MELEPYRDGNVQVRIFRDELIDERMYLVALNGNAFIVDPHVEEDILPYLDGLASVRVLLTHEHYDHVCGVNWLREKTCCTVYASQGCAASMESSPNSTVHFPLLFLGDRGKYDFVKKSLKLPYVCQADIRLGDSGLLDPNWRFWATKGHSPGGMSFLLMGKYLFSGDSLLGNGMELKSIGADRQQLRQTILSYRQLGGDVLVFPGHGEVNTLQFYLSKAGRYYSWI